MGVRGHSSPTSYPTLLCLQTAETTASRADRNRGEAWGKEQRGKGKGVWEKTRKMRGRERKEREQMEV